MNSAEILLNTPRGELAQVSPKDKPIHFVFANHNGPDIDKNKAAFISSVEEMIKKTDQQKKVAVFLEDASGSKIRSKGFTRFVEEGYTSLEAFVGGSLLQDKENDVTRTQIEETMHAYKDKINPRTLSLLENLDLLIKKYPHRLRLLSEWQPDSDLFIFREMKPSYRHWQVVKKAGNGDVSLCVPAYAQVVRDYAENLRERESRIGQTLKSELERDDVGGVVGRIGTAHTSFSHKLIAEGYLITREFPDKLDGSYIFSPDAAMVRKHIMRKNINSDNIDWLNALESVVSEIEIYDKAKNEGKALRPQKVNRALWHIKGKSNQKTVGN